MPSLYAADVSIGKPKPVTTTQSLSAGRSGKKSSAVSSPRPASAASTPPAAAPQENGAADGAKPKRQLTEETKAKLREARERKKAERELALKAEEEAKAKAVEEEERTRLAAEEKKRLAAEKRKEARLKRKLEKENAVSLAFAREYGIEVVGFSSDDEPQPVESAPSGSSSDEGSAKPPKAKRVRTSKKGKEPATATTDGDLKPGESPDSPPKWFTTFVTQMMEEKHEQEGSKISKKAAKEEGDRVAMTKWRDPHTRERIRSAADGHLGQMYSMIFQR